MLTVHRKKLYVEKLFSSRFVEKIIHICKSETGIIAVEFGLLLPVLLIMYLGMAATVIGIEINNKLASAAESIGNLTGRGSSVSDANLLNFFSASGSIMSPYSATPVKVKLGSIVRDKNGTIKKCWGVNLSNASAPPTVTATLPPDLSELGLPNELMPLKTTLIVVEATYMYEPPGGYFPAIPLTKKFYTRPRTSTEVVKTKTDGSILNCPS